jgi:hypothetical protein
MAKPYDVVTKELVAANPLAWVKLLGLSGTHAALLDTDLSTTVSLAADRLIRVEHPQRPYLTHIEFESGQEWRGSSPPRLG